MIAKALRRAEELTAWSHTSSMIVPTDWPGIQIMEGRVGTFRPCPDVGQILGHVIAHELGHLLGLDSHSPTGIMRADWSRTDLEDAFSGNLLFARQRAEKCPTRTI
jgi:hypothetical protein